jgi:signal transduction histidine kinase
MKTQLKIAFVLIFTSLIMLLFLGGSIYYFLYNYSFDDFYKRLKTRATLAAQFKFDANNVNAESFRLIREKHLERLDQEKEYFFIVNKDTTLQDVANLINLPKSFIDNIIIYGTDNLKKEETLYTGIKYFNKNKTYIVIVSAKNYYVSHHLFYVRNVILVGIVLLVAIVTYLSFYFSKHIFDPIKSITDKVKQIGSESIHLRIEEKYDDNEINRLVSTFNDLLNRLETAFEVQKNFISNASHEFGTPLTAIMGEAEVMLMKDRSPSEYKQSLKSILDQSERLNQITQTLLFLAETGYRNKVLETELTRTDELVWEAKTILDKLNPNNSIQIDMSLLPENPKKLKIYCNTSLLLIAFTNLLTNACKYSFNKPVTISIASSDENVVIIIKDNGVGIPKSEMPFIYDPFFRASNTHKFEGYGIGLPLCRNIIKIHNGQLSLFSIVDVGTTVEIKLPHANIV